ncbi:hypothetical protein CAPTEDRAFT_189250 [Capitella teleta]|uniref:DUF659 domain-containing protein n=1 Tax=Capitella teleta TaxID=283909 RepID=R7UKA2_CAPTE|nr:hypothetical protein CAPTEDRAFT_189250 [Capitella teleta]|eukprot:ELU06615.1 hypothetical protein CAPTEDRAFT_189250 [Capitella teleta]
MPCIQITQAISFVTVKSQIQPTIDQFNKSKQPWGAREAVWKANTRHLVEMIAVDLDPLSVVEKVFSVLRQWTTAQVPAPLTFGDNTHLSPGNVCGRQEEVGCEVGENSSRQLHKNFMGNTVDNNHEATEGMLVAWDLKDKFHTIVHDKAANAMKASHDADMSHVSCLAHTLQLVIHNALDTNGQGRHCRVTANRRPLQTLTQGTTPRLLASTPTSATCSTQRVLEPFYEMTLELSKAAAYISYVIPATKLLNSKLRALPDSGVGTFKDTLISSLERRFGTCEEHTVLTSATLLDPIFKDRFLSRRETLPEATAVISNHALTSSASTTNESVSPPAKRSRTEPPFWESMADFQEEETPAVTNENSIRVELCHLLE